MSSVSSVSSHSWKGPTLEDVSDRTQKLGSPTEWPARWDSVTAMNHNAWRSTAKQESESKSLQSNVDDDLFTFPSCVDLLDTKAG